MGTQATFGFKDLYHHLVGEMAKAVSERPGESASQRLRRTEAAVHMIMGFLPRDVIELMIAGHCVMLHEVMADSFRHVFASQPDAARRASIGGIVALDRCFRDNQTRLEQAKLRRSEGRRDAPGDAAVTAGGGMATGADQTVDLASVARAPEPVAANVVQADAARAPKVAAPVARAEAVAETYTPSPEAIAACLANPAAMAALDAGDAAAFARALGVAEPSDAYLAAAGEEGSPFTADSTPAADPAGRPRR